MYKKLKEKLQIKQSTWLITGVAGFIGSNLLEHLLNLDQVVVGLDNFATGHQRNLDEVKQLYPKSSGRNLHLLREISGIPKSVKMPAQV